ncbi:hypothetical protein MIND_00988900 [Mycena indigotica]|uniref:Uncharacterized protein n=1 Tax=Mycena indigotica TaxID=2126181 RepID=A0A8H6VUL4_9AGAR|nr:uncharacterized protein MIND_00988900 [Mycena indigotica]KAF7294524.1 hypothetical protein MIND_00988900 [Mycena indigotica]
MVDLRHLPSLIRLTIHASLTSVASVLRHLLKEHLLPGNSLAHLTLSVGFLTGVSYRPSTWRTIDKALADDTLFPELRADSIFITTHDPPSEYLDYTLSVLAAEPGVRLPIVQSLREHMAECHEKRLLRIDTDRIPTVTARRTRRTRGIFEREDVHSTRAAVYTGYSST